MLKWISVALLLITLPVHAQYQDSVQIEGFASSAEASGLIAYNPLGLMLPVMMQTNGQARVSWIAINPHIFTGERIVASAVAPPTSQTQCSYYCPGNTVYACSSTGFGGPLAIENFPNKNARDIAWNALSPLMRNYTAKLAIPIGPTVYYALVKPGTMSVSSPSIVCP